MKKMYLSLLLTTTTISVSCMEKEFYKYNHSQQAMIPEYALTTSYQSNMQRYSQPGYCEANEPSWEFYDDIANMSYNSHPPFAMQPSFIPTLQFVPVYKTTGSTIAQQEKKSLLKTNSLLPDKDIMQALYEQASAIIDRHKYGTHKPSQKYENERLVQIIKDMGNAKEKGINEDLMAEYAYKKDTWDLNTLESSILFALLKKYNATVQKTGEKLPFFSHQKTVCLKEILNTSNNTNTTTVTTDTTNAHNIITRYPTFFQFVYSVHNMAQGQLPYSPMKVFTTYLYKNNNILLEDYSDGSYKDFKSEFYTKAYDMLQAFLLETGINCYNLVQMIDKAKEVGDINDEDNLIAHMACYEGPQSFMTQLKSTFNSSHIDTERRRIVLFCKLAKIYNNKRGFKMTPTINQCHAYCAKKTLDIVLPEHLKNKDLFDENSYAFEEIAELKDATNLLKKLEADEINNLF